jgi:hypothetical protein
MKPRGVCGITLAYGGPSPSLKWGSQQLRRTVEKTTKVALFTALRNTRRKMGRRAQRLLVLRVSGSPDDAMSVWTHEQ